MSTRQSVQRSIVVFLIGIAAFLAIGCSGKPSGVYRGSLQESGGVSKIEIEFIPDNRAITRVSAPGQESIASESTYTITKDIVRFRSGLGFITEYRFDGESLTNLQTTAGQELRLERTDKPPRAQVGDERQPESFQWTYQFNEPEPGLRVWTREGRTWFERYPSGFIRKLQATGRTSVEGVAGAVVQPVTDPALQVFVPDLGSRKMWLRLRHGDGKWGFMGAMEKVN